VRDGVFPAADFTIPVEFDGFTRTFDGRMRNDLHAFLDDAGTSLGDARTGLRRTLAAGPGAVGEAASVMEDLDADKSALKTLVDSANRVMGAVRSSQPGLRDLLTGAAQTFDAIGSQTTALQQTLQRAPGMFATTRRTLAQADDTLDLAGTVTSRIGPGVKELRSLARPLNDTLRTVVRVAPDAKSTLRSVTAATPDLNPLLKRVEGLSPEVRSVGAQAVDNLECIRPYTPSIMAFFANWGDFFSFDDGRDKMIRAQVQNFLPAETNISDYNSAQAKKAWPGLEFGFPRPPGTDAGQPWFLPQCGAGPDALDPAKDPESRPYKSIFQLPKARTSAGVFRNLVGG
jgi:ABC-type transporter Mla subunit MlaD